jgi:Cu(I)/Ag(I) efflux system membrane fusion protein
MNRKQLLFALTLGAVGVTVGYLLGRAGAHAPTVTPAPPDVEQASQGQIWTCSMHPQVRLPGPGKCPICEMPLIPATAAAASAEGVAMLELSEHALAMARVETSPVERREMTHELRTVGKIAFDESSLATITSRVDGYAERLFVNVTGVELKAGDHLAEVYSPELLVAQQELLIALQSGANDVESPLAQAAMLKLRRLGLSEEQIGELVEQRVLADRVTLYSPIDGIVIEKSIIQNSAFEAGQALFRIADLDRVWVYLDVYEYDLGWVRFGQSVRITAEAIPVRTFEGKVTFVFPIVDEATRTVRVPVQVANEDHALMPGMFVSASLLAVLGADGSAAPTGVEGKYACPMHPHVLRDDGGDCPVCGMPLIQIPGTPVPPVPIIHRHICPMDCEDGKTYAADGSCPVCGMALEPVEGTPLAAESGVLTVPVSAVLDSGTRRLVYVERIGGSFEAREVVLGPRGGEWYPVLQGLAEGERVVSRGGFLIDSQFQITGHPSLFYPGGLSGNASPPAAATEHQH